MGKFISKKRKEKSLVGSSYEGKKSPLKNSWIGKWTFLGVTRNLRIYRKGEGFPSFASAPQRGNFFVARKAEYRTNLFIRVGWSSNGVGRSMKVGGSGLLCGWQGLKWIQIIISLDFASSKILHYEQTDKTDQQTHHLMASDQKGEIETILFWRRRHWTGIVPDRRTNMVNLLLWVKELPLVLGGSSVCLSV